jgi:hypothetical protein
MMRKERTGDTGEPARAPSIADEVRQARPLDPVTRAYFDMRFAGSSSGAFRRQADGRLDNRPKLAIGAPGDRYEVEADRMAARVMSLSEPARTTGGGESAAQGALQRKRDEHKAEAPATPRRAIPFIHQELGTPGRPLDATARAFMEPRFGHDFSAVRIHDDASAAASARSVNALAYTVGQDVVFGHGQYSPGTSAGKTLLAHELAHVVQQAPAPSSSRPDAGAAASSAYVAPYVARRVGCPETHDRRKCPIGESCGKGVGQTCQFYSIATGCECPKGKQENPVAVPAALMMILLFLLSKMIPQMGALEPAPADGDKGDERLRKMARDNRELLERVRNKENLTPDEHQRVRDLGEAVGTTVASAPAEHPDAPKALLQGETPDKAAQKPGAEEEPVSVPGTAVA